jgi:hypothetical protein
VPDTKRTLFGEAETRLRRVVLGLGLGFVAWVLGTAVRAAVVDPLVWYLPENAIETLPEAGRIALYAVTVHVWLFTTLPPLAWLSGRLSQSNPWTFAVLATLGGELFSVLSETAVSGIEGWVPTQWHLIAGALVFVTGVGLSGWVGQRGQNSADRAQKRAAQLAAQRQPALVSFAQKLDSSGSAVCSVCFSVRADLDAAWVKRAREGHKQVTHVASDTVSFEGTEGILVTQMCSVCQASSVAIAVGPEVAERLTLRGAARQS